MARRLFSFRGRLARLPYLGGSLAVMVLGTGVFFAVFSAAIAEGRSSDWAGPALAAIGVLLAWVTLALAARRLHDFDQSAWHLLWMLVVGSLPVSVQVPDNALLDGALQLLAFVACAWIAFPPGTRGPNRYGPAPVRPIGLS